MREVTTVQILPLQLLIKKMRVTTEGVLGSINTSATRGKYSFDYLGVNQKCIRLEAPRHKL